MKFIKMHGLGNDYVFVDCIRENPIVQPEAVAQLVSLPHFGIGSDGLVLIEPSTSDADARMRIFNKDGSEAEMCGNAVRCVGKYLYDSGICKRKELTVQTGAGNLPIELSIANGIATGATVDMGVPSFEPEKIPMQAQSNRICVEFEGKAYNFFCVSIGNPHAVTIDAFPQGDEFVRFGKHIERHSLFPKRVNVEFCRPINKNSAEVRVWERGSGATLACGTGASAALVAMACLGATEKNAQIVLPGGNLQIDWRKDGHVYMTGPATISFVGKFTDRI